MIESYLPPLIANLFFEIVLPKICNYLPDQVYFLHSHNMIRMILEAIETFLSESQKFLHFVRISDIFIFNIFVEKKYQKIAF